MSLYPYLDTHKYFVCTINLNIKQIVFKQSPSALGGQHDQRGLQIHFFLDNYCSAHQMFGQSLQDWMRFDRQQLTRHGWSLYDHSLQASNQIFKKGVVSDKMCQQGPKLDRTSRRSAKSTTAGHVRIDTIFLGLRKREQTKRQDLPPICGNFGLAIP